MNETTQAMLTAMNYGTESLNPDLLMQSLLSNLDQTDPRIGLVTQYLLQNQDEDGQTTRQTVLDDETNGDEINQRKRHKQHQHKIIHKLKRQMAEMQDELEMLRERNDTLAAALGACYLCWGTDSTCETCRGQGKPGQAMPDEALFKLLILPVIRYLKQVSLNTAGTPNHYPKYNNNISHKELKNERV